MGYTTDSMGKTGGGTKISKTQFHAKPRNSFGYHPTLQETNPKVKAKRDELKQFTADYRDLFPASFERAHYRHQNIVKTFKELRKKGLELEARYIKGEIDDKALIDGAEKLLKEYRPKYQDSKERIQRT